MMPCSKRSLRHSHIVRLPVKGLATFAVVFNGVSVSGMTPHVAGTGSIGGQ